MFIISYQNRDMKEVVTKVRRHIFMAVEQKFFHNYPTTSLIWCSALDMGRLSGVATLSFCNLFKGSLTLLHSEWPKLYGVLAMLSAIGLKEIIG